MCAYYSSYICNVGQFVKFLFTVLFYRQFRTCITNALGKAHTPKDERAHPKAPLVYSFASQIGSCRVSD